MSAEVIADKWVTAPTVEQAMEAIEHWASELRATSRLLQEEVAYRRRDREKRDNDASS